MLQWIKGLLYLFLIAYALLTIIAAISDIRAQGFKAWHSLYFIGALALLASLWPGVTPYLLPLALLAMIGIAIFNGWLTESLNWQHILVRTLISALLAAGWYYLS